MLDREFKYFIDRIRESYRILVFYHYDLDGLISAILIEKFLKNKDIEFKPSTLNLNNFKSSYLDEYDLIIFLDLATSYKFLGEKVFIFDHHEIEEKYKRYLNVINPKKYNKEVCYPTSKIVYDLIKDESFLHLFLIGFISDGCESEDFLKKFEEKYKTSRKVLFNIVKYLEAYLVLKGYKGSEYLFNFLKFDYSFESLKRKYYYFRQYYIKLMEEVNRLVEGVDEIGNLVFLEVNSKIPAILSYLANFLQDKYKDKIIIVYSKKNSEYVFSARSPKQINLMEVFEKVKKEIEVSFGGHKSALGGRVKNINKLKFLLEKALNKKNLWLE